MVITQKVTSLAFSIHDGCARSDQELTKSQKLYAVYKVPTTLEYFSYALHFPALMAGPVLFYRDYIDFIQGNNFIQLNQPVSTLFLFTNVHTIFLILFSIKIKIKKTKKVTFLRL